MGNDKVIVAKRLLCALGMALLLAPAAVFAAETATVIVPINLAFPLLPTTVVIVNTPPLSQDHVLVIVSQSDGLVGIARINGGN